MRLLLIHRARGEAQLPGEARLWRTCVRDVAFLGDSQTTVAPDGAVADAEAYSLLLEIVCGLRSPLLGETEVQAQFKSFLSSLNPAADAALLQLGQRVLADAKLIRSKYLQNFGAQSYGTLAARYVPLNHRVALVGTGALAEEIAAALEGSRLDRWNRRRTARYPDVYLFSEPWHRPSTAIEATALIIAAPVNGEDLAAVLDSYASISAVVDLRAEGERTLLPSDVRVITLDDVFRDARQSRPVVTLQAARREIQRLGDAYAHREELRPFGWDDLCA